MREKLVTFDGILRALHDRGPMTTEALANDLDRHRLVVLIALLDAATWGLVCENERSAWILSKRGLAAIRAGADQGKAGPRS